MPADNNNGTWFGISMFLLGLIAGGAIAVSFGGGLPSGLAPNIPAAPNAPTAPTAQVPQKTFTDRFAAAVKAAGVDEAAYATCIDSKKFDKKITDQMAQGQAEGVNGTPGNILLSLKTNKAWLLSGAQPQANFEKAIDAMIKDPNAAPPEDVEVAVTVPVLNFNVDHIRGDRNALVALFEYSDYECPFCTRVHPTYQALMEKYDGKIMWIFRHFPLSFHPNALPAAVASECIAELKGEDAFWDFTDAVFKG